MGIHKLLSLRRNSLCECLREALQRTFGVFDLPRVASGIILFKLLPHRLKDVLVDRLDLFLESTLPPLKEDFKLFKSFFVFKGELTGLHVFLEN